MGYYFSTRSGTTYTVIETEKPDIMSLSGGQYEHHRIYKPDCMIGEGQPFSAVFVHDEKNTQMGLAGRTLRTSPIQSLHTLPTVVPDVHARRVAQAEGLYRQADNTGMDFSYD